MRNIKDKGTKEKVYQIFPVLGYALEEERIVLEGKSR